MVSSTSTWSRTAGAKGLRVPSAKGAEVASTTRLAAHLETERMTTTPQTPSSVPAYAKSTSKPIYTHTMLRTSATLLHRTLSTMRWAPVQHCREPAIASS